LDLENRPPRLSIEIEPELKKRLDDVISWGQCKRLIGTLVEELIELLEDLEPREREITKALIITRKVKVKEILPSFNEEV